MRRHRFGTRSEALDQLELTLEDEEIARAVEAPVDGDVTDPTTDAPKGKPKRKPLPDHLPRNGIRLLTTKRPENHSGLFASAQKWEADEISKTKSVEVRYAPAGALHDRLVIIDSRESWLVSQSIKDIAKRSPASVTRAEAELGQMKAKHNEALWNPSTPLA